MTDITEHYLGDGLYVSYDGVTVTLRAPRPNGDHWIGLDPTTLARFLRYLKDHVEVKG